MIRTGILNGYIEAALWCGLQEEDEDFAHDYDLSDESLSQMAEDCKEFIQQSGDLLEEVDLHDDQIGQDFWLTRNRHGVGFWDRGLGEPGDKLSDIAQKFYECSLYVNHENRCLEIIEG